MQAVAAGSLLAIAFRPLPRAAAAGPLVVTNTNPAGPGSLYQAVQDANAQAGADVITFDPAVTGTIALTSTLHISDSVTIQGPGPGKLSVSGGNTRRVFYLYSPSQAVFTTTISGLTIRDGKSTKGGGGIYDSNANLTLDLVNVLSNTAGSKGNGGGLDFADSATITVGLTIRNSLISGNFGGGVSLYFANSGVVIQNSQFVSNTAGSGGGVFLYHPASLLIEDSSFLSNTATNAGGGLNIGGVSSVATVRRTTFAGNRAAKGGGVFLYHLNRPASIENTTISGNTSTSLGGGIFLYDTSNLGIKNSTIVSNTAGIGGGIYMDQRALPITDTIVAGNTAITLPVSSDLTGTFQLSYDLVQVTGTAHITDTGGNLFGLDPLLGPLADNGGATQTQLPLRNSPVIDAGDPAFAAPLASTDQRGRRRVVNGRVDIGAVETLLEEFLPLIRR